MTLANIRLAAQRQARGGDLEAAQPGSAELDVAAVAELDRLGRRVGVQNAQLVGGEHGAVGPACRNGLRRGAAERVDGDRHLAQLRRGLREQSADSRLDMRDRLPVGADGGGEGGEGRQDESERCAESHRMLLSERSWSGTVGCPTSFSLWPGVGELGEHCTLGHSGVNRAVVCRLCLSPIVETSGGSGNKAPEDHTDREHNYSSND